MNRSKQPRTRSDRPEAADLPLAAGRPWLRLVGSLVICLHVMAVFVAPWAGPPPSSELARSLASAMSGYLVAAHLNHGYRFFAPDPGPSHLVRYEVQAADGLWHHGRFPHRDDHWPRLLYHRHFMISESIFNLIHHPTFLDRAMIFSDSERPLLDEPIPPDLPRPLRTSLELQRKKAETLVHAIARRLLDEHSGQRVRLYLQEHAIAFPEDVQRGMKLDDPVLFQERLLADVSRDG